MGSNAPIGVFDSGVGGLTVVKEIMKQLPEEELVYFGDTARVPYGDKSKDTVIGYSRQIAGFLRTKEVKAIVIACNTATAFALETLRAENDIPVIGVVEPGARMAAKTTKNGKVGVIGTLGTINSGIYTEYIHKNNPEIQVFSEACPLFVPLVEEGILSDAIVKKAAECYLSGLMENGIDSLVMGCTHYPLIDYILREVVGEEVTLVNPAYETTVVLKEILKEKGLLRKGAQPEHRFYVSDGVRKFQTFADTVLPQKGIETAAVNIEKYEKIRK